MKIDLSVILRTTEALITGFLGVLPRLAVALLVLGVFYLVGRGVRSAVRQYAARRSGDRALELAIGRLAQSVIILLGLLFAAVAAFPSFTPADLVSTLGIGGWRSASRSRTSFRTFSPAS